MAKRIPNNYWDKRRYKEIMRLAEKAEKETDILLAREYIKIRDRVIKDMENLYNKILLEVQDGEPLVSHLYSYNRYFEQIAYLDKQLNKLGVRENKVLNSQLTQLYTDNSQKIGSQFNLIEVNASKAKNAVNRIWCQDGLTWSQRIWRDTGMLKGRLMNSMVECLTMGKGTEDMTKMLMNDFNVSYNSARRIARTEINHIQTQSTIDKYKEAGIEKYRVLSNQAKDESCLPLNGREFLIEEQQVGFNCPPFHPNCRCCILAVIE